MPKIMTKNRSPLKGLRGRRYGRSFLIQLNLIYTTAKHQVPLSIGAKPIFGGGFSFTLVDFQT